MVLHPRWLAFGTLVQRRAPRMIMTLRLRVDADQVNEGDEHWSSHELGVRPHDAIAVNRAPQA